MIRIGLRCALVGLAQSMCVEPGCGGHRAIGARRFLPDPAPPMHGFYPHSVTVFCRTYLVGIQASGVDGIGPLHRSIDELCAAYLDEILADRADRAEEPDFLAGFSSGGIIAVELAARLTKGANDVGGVALLDTFHPDVQGPCSATPSTRGCAAALRPCVCRERRTAHEAPVYPGDVWLFASTMLKQRFAHVGMDRGWTSSAPHLDVVPISARHDDIRSEPSVSQASRR